MGNCKDCKFWESHNDGRRKWHTCEKADFRLHYDKIADDEFAVFADCLDDSGMYAGLKTGPDFGCTKFVAKR